MKGILIIASMALIVMGCAAADVIVKIDGHPVVKVEGNAPGRTVAYAGNGVTITVTDSRTPNPAMDIWNTAKEFVTGIFGRAQLAVGGG